MTNIERLKAKLQNAAKASEDVAEKLESMPKKIDNRKKEIKEITVPSGNNIEQFDLKIKLVKIDILKVEANPFQPRTKFENIEELANNILKHGLLQPLTVYLNDEDNKYYLIAGERRNRALRLLHERGQLNDTKYKVNLVENILTDEEKRSLATIENTHRENMTIIDMANNAKSYVESGMSYSEVAKLFSVGKTVISRYMKISSLPQKVQEVLNTKEVKSPNKIELLCSIKDEKIQLEFSQYILQDISISSLELKIKKYLNSIKEEQGSEKVVIETPFDKVKPVSKILSKAQYRKLPENKRVKADEILEEVYKLQQKLLEVNC